MCVFVHMSVSECVFCFPMAFIKWKQEGNIKKKMHYQKTPWLKGQMGAGAGQRKKVEKKGKNGS